MKQVLLIALVMLVAAAAYAKTPDGETPANEGVCDDLIGAPPGLYGLCIAFCEAQDCEPDDSLADPFENCNTSSERILENYNRKKQDWDPEMPCIQEPCPCWTIEELEALGQFPDWAEDVSYCIGHQGIHDYWRVISDDWCIRHRVRTLATGSPVEYQCHFRIRQPCTSDPSISRTFNISFEEFEVCRAQLIQAGTDLGFDCWN